MKKLFLLAGAIILGCSIANAEIAPPMSTVEPPASPKPQMRGDGPPPAPTLFSVTVNDPAFETIISTQVELIELARGFGLNEGPVWFPDGKSGFVLVSGLLDNVIYKVTLDKKVSVFLDYAGYTGKDPEHTGAQTRSGRSHVLLIGPSCTGRDPEGRLIWCADNDRAVMRLEKDGTRTILSAGYDGKRFNAPNDIAIKSDGAIYLADNDFGLRDAGKSADKQMSDGIYLIKDGKTIKLMDDKTLGGIPNGIALSPDGKYLYLSAGFDVVKRYSVQADDTIGPGIEFTKGVGIGDGMKTDLAGNVYSTSGGGPGIVRVTAPSGKLLGTINLPIYGGEPKRQICATNVAFGGADGKSLFITACDALYEVRLKTPGLRNAMTESTKEFDAVIVGAGFSGLYMLYKLRKHGLRCRLFEAGDGVGGAWYWNRYPGARCDSESYFYCYSFSDEILQEWTWSERFPAQPEIEKYLNFVADRLDLRKDMQFNSRVTSATYDEVSMRWTVETDAGDKVRIRYVVTAIGGLSAISPNLPAIPGIKDFRGQYYHTGHWPKEGVDLRGKRVGVIGTGSTGIQAIPVIAEQAADLTVFQRTPAYIMPAKNAPLEADEVAKIKANYDEIWRKAKAHRGGQPYDLPAYNFSDVDENEARRLQQEYWDRGGLRVAQLFKDAYTNPKAREFTENFFRSKVREIVKDSATAEILEPKGYPFGAKRIALDTNYYETFNLPHVHVVDAKKNKITRITPTGIRAGDKDYPLDVIVFATGFDAVTGPFRDIDFRGRDGLRLADRLADGPRAYLGLSFAGFPNLLAVSGPCNPALSTNVPVSIEHDVEWIADCIEYCEKNRIKAIEATEEAEEAWTEDTQAKVRGSMFEQADSWQFGSNIPGKPRRFLLWLGGLTAFREKCTAVAKAGYEGFALKR